MNQIRRAILAGILSLFVTFPALALDINDVKLMLQNRVQENVIISMIQNQALVVQVSFSDP